MDLTADHDLAIDCLPIDGRWQTEAQLIGQTKLSAARSRTVYEELVEHGFCDQKAMPIICRIVLTLEYTRQFRCRWQNRKRYFAARFRGPILPLP